MHREGHIGIGLLLYAPIAFVLFELQLSTVFGLGLVAMAFWSFAPDIDMTLPIPHRGPTHTIVAAVVAGILTAIAALYFASNGSGGSSSIVIKSWILAYLAAAAFGFGIGFLGVISHLIGDVLTPMGIRPWRPFSDRKHSLELVQAKNKWANQKLSMVGGVALVAAIVLSELV